MTSKTTTAMPIDVVCGTDVNPKDAIKTEYEGQTYYFCCPSCKTEFLNRPQEHLKKTRRSQKQK